ncbi:MAG: NAD-dependent epimerase/dehydratase family protein [Candidatus Gastranaerophilales bacterium]
MDKKKLLLTGSGGFVGQNLKTFLSKEYCLFAPRSFELNLCDSNAVEKYFEENNIDFIIHCSSIGGYRTLADKDTTIEDNLAMVDNLLTFKAENARIILFGSGAMYEKKRELKKVQEFEIGNYVPADLYGKSKLLIYEKIKNRRDVTCLNIFGSYGNGETPNRFPTYAISQNLNHQPIEINQNVVFDYLFIEDLCKIIEFFVKSNPSQNIINVTPTKSISLLEIANIINDISDFKSEIMIKDESLNFEYTGDNNRLLKEIEGFEFTSYKKGLKKLFDTLKEKYIKLNIGIYKVGS